MDFTASSFSPSLRCSHSSPLLLLFLPPPPPDADSVETRWDSWQTLVAPLAQSIPYMVQVVGIFFVVFFFHSKDFVFQLILPLLSLFPPPLSPSFSFIIGQS